MVRTVRYCLLALIVTCHSASAADSVQLTVRIRGVITDGDAEVINETLRNVDGVDLGDARIERGERGPFRHYFSPPIEIELSNPEQLDIGELAKAIAEAETPSREELPPSLNLIVFDRRAVVDEDDIGAIREAVRGTGGIDPDGPGTIGGVPRDGTYRIRIDDSGEARIEEIAKALREASTEYRLQKQQ